MVSESFPYGRDISLFSATRLVFSRSTFKVLNVEVGYLTRLLNSEVGFLNIEVDIQTRKLNYMNIILNIINTS